MVLSSTVVFMKTFYNIARKLRQEREAPKFRTNFYLFFSLINKGGKRKKEKS